MSGTSQLIASSQNSQGVKRKWVLEEDAVLVTCMVELHNIGTFNADTGFKVGYLNELERMIENVLPHAILKAKPNLESRIRTLKRDWATVYDMLSGRNNSGFGWDEHKQMVVAEDAVWNSYISSHKAVGQFRHRSFPYYKQLTFIYAKDRVFGNDAQTVADIIEEIDAEDVATTNNLEKENNYYECEDDVSLDEMDVSAKQSQTSKPNQNGSTSSKKKKKISDGSDQISTSIIDATIFLGENIRTVEIELSRTIVSEKMIEESAKKLYSTLCKVEGLTEDERFCALSKIPDHPTQMIVFFNLPSSVRLKWVRRFLSSH